MRRYLSRDQLRRVQCEPVPFLEQTLNGLVDASRQNGFGLVNRGLWQDQFGQHVRPLPGTRSPEDWVSCVSQDDVPPFGIVEVYDARWDSDLNEWILKVRKATSYAQMYAANEDYQIGKNEYGWVRIVNPYVPRVVSCYGYTPTFLEQVVTFGTQVTAGSGEGLQCVGTADFAGHVAVMSLPSGAGGSGLQVRFEVAVSGTGVADMICQIVSVPSGMTLSQMPGQIGGGTGLIHVCDPSGCFFNDPAADLLGAIGWAQYMQPLVVSLCQEYPPLVPEWEVYSLCCTNIGC